MFDLITFEHAYYIGSFMSSILYGISMMMYLMTMQGLFSETDNQNSPRSKRFFVIYSTILFFLITLNIAINAVWGENMWITFRDIPGGAPVWFAENVSVWYQTMGSTATVCMIFMGDALLVHRLFIIYGSNYYVIAFPCIAYLAGLVLAIIELVSAGTPGGNFFHGKAVDFGVPYYTITIGLNIVITSLICFRLSRLGKAVERALGPDSATMYTSFSAMLIESAALYSAVGVMFLIPYALKSGTAIAFGQVWAKLTCIAPQLIVLRVVTGRAWRREIVTQAESNIDVDSGFMHQESGVRSTGVGFPATTVIHGNGGIILGDMKTSTVKWAGNDKLKSKHLSKYYDMA